jgi:hypothetical protein
MDIPYVIPMFKDPFGIELKPARTPIIEGYHSEVVNTPLLIDEDLAKYRSIISYFIWMIVLERFDIAYTTLALCRCNMAPREGIFKAVKRIWDYLKTFPKGRVIIDTIDI